MDYQYLLNVIFSIFGQWIYSIWGFVLFWAVFGIAYKATHKTRVPKTEFILFVGNLIFVAWGITLSLYAVALSEGIIEMSDIDKANLAVWITAYINLVYAFVGIFAGAILLWIIKAIKLNQVKKPNKEDWEKYPDNDRVIESIKRRG